MLESNVGLGDNGSSRNKKSSKMVCLQRWTDNSKADRTLCLTAKLFVFSLHEDN